MFSLVQNIASENSIKSQIYTYNIVSRYVNIQNASEK